LFTVTSPAPTSPAMSFENAMISAFGIVVVNVPASSCRPVTPDTLRMRGEQPFLMNGTASFVA